MPLKPRPACSKNGCPNLAFKHGLCQSHIQQYEIKRRIEPTLYDARWRLAREMYLKEHPYCVECSKEGNQVLATCVDHIKAHKGNIELFWNQSNWQASCKRHNDMKAARGE